MLTETEFVHLLDDELGLPIGPADLGRDIAEVAGWDSVYLLRLLGVLESRVGRPLPLPELLEIRTLRGIHRLAVRNG
ncbi:MAG: phosphopantetheine-binding protein [Kibdelosporangium sp.]